MKKTSILAFVSLFLLSGCGLIPLSAAEQGYVDDCKKVQANFNEYIKLSDSFKNAEYNDPEFDWDSWSGGYAVTNAGQASRDFTYGELKSKFSWIFSITQSYFENMSRKEFLKQDSEYWADDIEWTVYQEFFRQMAKGSNFDITIDLLKKIQDSSYSLELDEVFASFTPSDRFKNCDDALGLKDEQTFESLSSDYGLYGFPGIHVPSISEISIALWGCEKFGVGYVDYGIGWVKCAMNDYVSDPSDFPTSSEPTPEEIAILAERKAQGERDAQAPSNSGGSLSVTPGQGCSSLGATVQTDSYGTLTCKLVILNRIKAFVWMR